METLIASPINGTEIALFGGTTSIDNKEIFIYDPSGNIITKHPLADSTKFRSWGNQVAQAKDNTIVGLVSDYSKVLHMVSYRQGDTAIRKLQSYGDWQNFGFK